MTEESADRPVCYDYRFETFTNATVDGLLIIDAFGVVEFANPAAVAMFAGQIENLVGFNFGTPAVLEPTELQLPMGREIRYVEMRASTFSWNGREATLAILRDITERKQVEDQLRVLSVQDPLTKLFNRRGLTITAEQELRHIKRLGGMITIIFMDINGMKRINDTYGHDMGDSVLVSVAQVLRETFRESDIIARIGGDEFVVVALNTAMDTVQLMKARLRENLKNCNYPFDVSLACGAVEYSQEKDLSLNHLLMQADLEMYKDKQQD